MRVDWFTSSRVILLNKSFLKVLASPKQLSVSWYHFREKREQLEGFSGRLPESKGLYLAVTVLFVPNSLDSGNHRPSPPDQILDSFGIPSESRNRKVLV